MRAFDERLTREQRELDAQSVHDTGKLLRIAVEIHHQIGVIHPFADANGRVARLSMNHFLRRYGAGYVIYPPLSESPEFWEALPSAHHGDLGPLVAFAERRLHKV